MRSLTAPLCMKPGCPVLPHGPLPPNTLSPQPTSTPCSETPALLRSPPSPAQTGLLPGLTRACNLRTAPSRGLDGLCLTCVSKPVREAGAVSPTNSSGAPLTTKEIMWR